MFAQRHFRRGESPVLGVSLRPTGGRWQVGGQSLSPGHIHDSAGMLHVSKVQTRQK